MAAEKISNPEIKKFCHAESMQRAEYAAELERQMRNLKETEIDRSGSAAGTLHRAWIDIQSAAGAGDGSILSSVEQGEDAAKKSYENVLSGDLPSSLKAVLQMQYQGVLAAHNQIKGWRDRLKAA